MPKIMCKYCQRGTRLVPGDDIYECQHCGYGLAPMEAVRKAGSYRNWMTGITAEFRRRHGN